MNARISYSAERQAMECSLTVRRVRVTIIAVEKQEELHSLSVCL
jgi:hypothetical protein